MGQSVIEGCRDVAGELVLAHGPFPQDRPRIQHTMLAVGDNTGEEVLKVVEWARRPGLGR